LLLRVCLRGDGEPAVGLISQFITETAARQVFARLFHQLDARPSPLSAAKITPASTDYALRRFPLPSI
jgi:hypothetical protein